MSQWWSFALGVLQFTLGLFLWQGIRRLIELAADYWGEARGEREAARALRRMAEDAAVEKAAQGPPGSTLHTLMPNSKNWSWAIHGPDCALAPDPDWLYNGAINGATEETSALPHVKRDE